MKLEKTIITDTLFEVLDQCIALVAERSVNMCGVNLCCSDDVIKAIERIKETLAKD